MVENSRDRWYQAILWRSCFIICSGDYMQCTFFGSSTGSAMKAVSRFSVSLGRPCTRKSAAYCYARFQCLRCAAKKRPNGAWRSDWRVAAALLTCSFISAWISRSLIVAVCKAAAHKLKEQLDFVRQMFSIL